MGCGASSHDQAVTVPNPQAEVLASEISGVCKSPSATPAASKESCTQVHPSTFSGRPGGFMQPKKAALITGTPEAGAVMTSGASAVSAASAESMPHEPKTTSSGRPKADNAFRAKDLAALANAATAAVEPFGKVDHVSQCAVSLKWVVEHFLTTHPEVLAEDMSTAQVVQRIVKPQTAAKTCRYVATLVWGAKANPAAVSRGKAFFFISHGWARPFSELVEMLKKHFSPEQQRVWRHGQPIIPWSQVFVWLDIFAINQHPGDNQRSDLECLKEVLADAEQTLMVMDVKGAVLTRIWCLYEAWQTSRKGRGKLVILAYGIEFEPLQKVFLELDVARAQATCEDDLRIILHDIQQDKGVRAMNHDIKHALVASAVAEVPGDSHKVTWSPELGYKLSKAAQLCQLYGRLDEAEPFYRRDLKGREEQLGPDHISTLSCINNLASLLHLQGKYAEAKELYRRVVQSMPQASGPGKSQALASLNNLAALLKAEGNYAEAEAAYTQVLQGLKETCGPDHPDTLSALSNLSSLLYSEGRYAEAEPMLRQVVEGSEKALGPDHPGTLTSVNELAMLLKALRKYDESERCFRRALSGREIVLGAEHQDHAATLNNLASLMYAEGKHDEAEALYRRALESLQQSLGLEHPDVLSAQNNLAMVLKAQGHLEEAEALYRQVLRAREGVLGPDHPNTLTSANNLAMLLKATGRLDDAEPLYRMALEGRRKVLGPEHPNTLSSMSNLASLLKEEGKLREAESLFREGLRLREKVLGPTHPDTVSSLEWLIDLLQAVGRHEEAQALQQRMQ